MFRERFFQIEARITDLFSDKGRNPGLADQDHFDGSGPQLQEEARAADAKKSAAAAAPPKKAARTIDEDDYGDDDDDDEEDNVAATSPLHAKSSAATPSTLPPHLQVPTLPKPSDSRGTPSSSGDGARTSEDVRKKLEQSKKELEERAKKTSYTLFHTLETDRDAMLEQQKLDELDRQVENEMSGQSGGRSNNAAGAAQQGSLSNANLGASNLTLKHLIARIDKYRDRVEASDSQLRSLISEVRKNRSKWASEDKVGQEELYEACEKVLMELKAQTEHSAPFLQRVNKREVPDYYSVIKHPMDMGTMIKKLKSYHYKSKKEFVDDLNLIWANCLQYNADPQHYLRKKALYMRKETEKLVPLIPDIVVRDRAEVEAEERRLQNGDNDGEGIEDSEDEEPIMASRGRKAPSKGKKGSTAARKAPPHGPEGTPGAESKPPMSSLLGAPNSGLRTEVSRAGSDAPMDSNGFATPPPGTLTPLGAHGAAHSGAPPSQADASEVDATGVSVNGLPLQADDPDLDDIEFKTWKQVTKKDRAIAAAERNRMFHNERLNVEAQALLRSKAGMRRWLRQQKQAQSEEKPVDERAMDQDAKDSPQAIPGETLAEGIEEEEDRTLPDYYDPVNAIPDIDDRLKWVEDSNGEVVDPCEEYLRMMPKGYFTSPESNLTKKMDANMRQMQDTRRICAKIGIVKQMQLQSQMYQNQFQKYDPQPFVEVDTEPLVVQDDSAILAPWACRAALQRSVGKLFYHAGFEEFQPSALEAATDIAGTYFANLVKTLTVYRESPQVPGEDSTFKPMFSPEEQVIHCLDRNGLDLESLEGYVKDDVERLGSKLGVMHERMKAHLSDLLRPALDSNAGADGAGAFNDGSEQFVGGDFADEIGEDFFGFKELGLDKEFGLSNLSVPLHLLQNRMHSAYQAQNANATTTVGVTMDTPPQYEPVTSQNVGSQIGLVQPFFRKKLRENGDEPLIEDEDLPAKQRFPKPRLPPTGKISSPRKRPLREQQQMAKKKRKIDEGKEVATGGGEGANNSGGTSKPLAKPVGKLKLEMPNNKEKMAVDNEPEKDDGSGVGILSPESIAN
ncbi:hypothetical protein BDY21DRAFT_282509 [Lineolata rhizophorae]|uniref:SAGA complex subunit Spt7 n=1 Tax=Lineolata rhizophorae TaxID=578093 RepID=A0A6A6P7Q4_9PEZI|nr:hypothetical protein BDY21DRAFT_282509 [Lineolata rhizophorae]